MSMKLLSRAETMENNSFQAANPNWDKRNAFEVPYVEKYEINVSTPYHALARMHEDRNELLVILKVPHSDYKNENIQKLLTWGRARVHQDDYYRDIAVHVKEAEDFERTIVFTHAEIGLSTGGDTAEDFIMITVTIHQKRDKLAGVMFGDSIEETYQKAWKKVMNPPRPFVVRPDVKITAAPAKVEYAANEKTREQMMKERLRNFIDNAELRKLSYLYDSRELFIYCNFPEKLTPEAYGEVVPTNLTGTCLNKVEMRSGGKGRIFYSYNAENGDLAKINYFCIQVYNPDSEKVAHFNIGKKGHASSEDYYAIGKKVNWDYLALTSWMKYYQSTNEENKEVENKTPLVILDEKIEGGIFSGILDFSCDLPVIISVFWCKTSEKTRPLNSTGTAKQLPYRPGDYDELTDAEERAGLAVYSGYGYGYRLEAEEWKLKAGECKDQYVYFRTNSRDNSSDVVTTDKITGQIRKGEIIPILVKMTDSSGKEYFRQAAPGEKRPLHNLCNWSVEYEIPVSFYNDLDTAVTFSCGLQPGLAVANRFPIVRFQGEIQAPYDTDALFKDGEIKLWNWKTFTVKPKETLSFSYTYILGTNSSADMLHVFRCHIL